MGCIIDMGVGQSGRLGGRLLVKSVLEERWMRLEHPGYVIYAQRTASFLPGLL